MIEEQLFSAHEFTQQNIGEFVSYVEKYLEEQFGDVMTFLGRQAVRETIHTGIKRAERYRIVSQYGVCLYIYLMFTHLGAFFDEDPLYPDLRAQLLDDQEDDAFKMEAVLAKAHGHLGVLYQQGTSSFLLDQIRLARNGTLFHLSSDEDPFDQVKQILQRSLPTKWYMVDTSKYLFFQQNICFALKACGIQSVYHQASCVGLSFLFGYCIFIDPRLEQVSCVMQSKKYAEYGKMEYLRHTVRDMLRDKLNILQKENKHVH